MFRPRDFVGIEFYVRVRTPHGVLERWLRAFDRQDAKEQAMEYCRGESLLVLDCRVY